MDSKLTYEQALAQLEKLVEQIEAPDKKLNALSDDLKKAMELIKYCKNCLKKTEEDLSKIVED